MRIKIPYSLDSKKHNNLRAKTINDLRKYLTEMNVIRQKLKEKKHAEYFFSAQYNSIWTINNINDFVIYKDYSNLIELRSQKNKLKQANSVRYYSKSRKTKHIDYDVVKSLNKLLRETLITTTEEIVKNTVIKKREENSTYDVWLYNLMFFGRKISENDIDLSSMYCYRRIFNVSWRKGGRFYSDGVSLPKEIRQSLKLNGQDTVELDYNSMHVHLAAHELDVDPDRIVGTYEELQRVMDLSSRKDAKRLWNLMVNSSPEDAPDTLDEFAGVDNLEWCLPLFYAQKGVELQFKESQVAQSVIKHFVEKGIPIIPTHDSFIVQKQYKEDLHTVMISAFSELYGKKYVPEIS